MSPSEQALAPPTVAHIITDLQTGGAESMLVRLLSASPFAQTSRVFSMRGRGTRGAQIEALGVPLETFGMSARPGILRAAYKLHRSIGNVRAQVVQGWMYHANVAATLVTWHDPNVVHAWNIRESLQDISHEKVLTRGVIRLGAALSDRPAAIIYNSRASAAQHERFGYSDRHAIVIPNGIDIGAFKQSDAARATLRTQLRISPDSVLVGRLGRFHPMKDFPCMLAAAAVVLRTHPDVHFVLGGPGVTDENRALSTSVEDLGLRGRVHCLGDVSDIPGFMAALDVNCSSSAWGEAFPNVILEAMAAHVPCVTTDVGDSAWVLGKGGLVVPPANPSALANALIQVLQLDAAARRKLGDVARRRVETEFNVAGVAARYDALYTELARRSHG